VVDEYVRELDSSPDRLAHDLCAMGYGGGLVVDDASGGYAQQGVFAARAMRHVGFRVSHPKKNPFVMDRVAAVRAKICTANGRRSLFIDPKCKKLIKALKSQAFWHDRPDKACGYFDDINDALGYPIYRFWKPKWLDVPEHDREAA
jgi:hypothetical protein